MFTKQEEYSDWNLPHQLTLMMHSTSRIKSLRWTKGLSVVTEVIGKVSSETMPTRIENRVLSQEVNYST